MSTAAHPNLVALMPDELERIIDALDAQANLYIQNAGRRLVSVAIRADLTAEALKNRDLMDALTARWKEGRRE